MRLVFVSGGIINRRSELNLAYKCMISLLYQLMSLTILMVLNTVLYYSFVILFLESFRYVICICAAMTVTDVKLGYIYVKWCNFTAAIALSLAQCYCFDLLDK